MAGALIFVPITLAHVPTAGWVREYTADNQSLPWQFAGTYPSWVNSAAAATLDTYQADPATNNSRAPIFSQTTGGSGRVYYSGSLTSPCSGSSIWLACAIGGGTSTWKIYIRNLDLAPYHDSGANRDWAWWDESCNTSTDFCFYLRRSVIHETIHVTMAVVNHDAQGYQNTVMSAGQPAYNNNGWNYIHYVRCDEAAAQLAYDLGDWYGPYGDCFDHITNHGLTGLQTDLTVPVTSFSECNGIGVSVDGRLQVKALSSYGRLSGNPLAGRTVWFDRSGTLKYTSTAANSNSGNNWSKAFSESNVTYTFTAHFDDASGDGLDDSQNQHSR